MCICLNCSYIKNCMQYNFIEKLHKEKFITKNIFFYPYHPVLNISFFNSINDTNIEWDVFECNSFIEEPGNWNFVWYRKN